MVDTNQKKIALRMILYGVIPSILLILQAKVNTPIAFGDITLPAGHLIELLLTIPITPILYLLIILGFLGNKTDDQKHPTGLIAVTVLFLIFFGLGSGIHFSANSLHQFAIDSNISGDIMTVAYYYDEVLSHWITNSILLLFLLMLGLWQVWDFQVNKNTFPLIERIYTFGLVCSAIFMGLILAIAMLEGQTPVIGLILSTVLLTVSVYQAKKHRMEPLRYPGTLFSTVTLSMCLLGIICWFAYFGGFPEPLTVF